MISPNPEKPSLDIAIVGGGVAGLTLAIGLLRKNINVTIYEAAREFGEIGAGVGFGRNAKSAMALIDPAIKEGCDRISTSSQWESKRQNWFEFRHGVDKGDGVEFGKQFHHFDSPGGQSNLKRAAFLDELIKLLPHDISHFHKKLESIEDRGDDGVLLKFMDGTEATHAAVVGCDGVKSIVRQYLLGKDNPLSHASFSGKVCFRGLIPMEKAVEVLGEELAQNNQVYMRHHSHMVSYPVGGGKLVNMVVITRRPSWDSHDWIVSTTKEEIMDEMTGWAEPVRNIVSSFEKFDVWALFDHADRPASTYCKGRVCITGDAAHASTPHQGAGAGFAIEDSFVLSSLLEYAKDADMSIETAFRGYDAVRRGRTQKLVSTSREAGKLYSMELEGVGDDLDRFRQNANTRMSWIWDEDVAAEAEEGKKWMAGHCLL